uniref:Amidohydrolase-related domain-containing protein n=1 Tax=Bionectria ochroleuca TaxID=29856 RepID=A0A0B7JSL2_BIOOC
MSPSQVLDGANRQVFLGTFVHSKSRAELEYMHDTAIYVDEHGVIVKVQTSGSDTVEETLEDLGWDAASVDRHVSTDGQFFFPGLIGECDAGIYLPITRWFRYANQAILDTHVHASQYPNVGIFGKTTLLDWLEKYTFPLESSLKDLNKARRVYSACVRRTLAHGTTTAAYYATTDVAATNLLADLCLKMGQRAFVGRVSMDNPDLCPDYYRDESAQASAELTEQTIQHIQNADPGYEIVSPIVTPRFAPSQAALVSRHVAMGEEGGDGHKLTVDEVLYLATRGGAICVGLEDKIGGFEEGKHWDAQLIGMRTVGSGEGEDGEREDESEDSNVDLFGWEDWEERMAKWLYGGDDRNTKKVWVKGRLVHSRRGSDRQTK